jgi:hypothetical protein
MNLKDRGSKTAKDGFLNEQFVVDKFNNWQVDEVAQSWLLEMGYILSEIKEVTAIKVGSGFKSDIQANVKLILNLHNGEIIDINNIQVKLVSNPTGYNQIDKRWTDKYIEMWSIPEPVGKLLKEFSGETVSIRKNLKDPRRVFLNELESSEQKLIVDFFKENKLLVVTDIFKGHGDFAADWMLVICKIDGEDQIRWGIKNINIAMNHFSKGEVVVTSKGSLKIGKITLQRKGGDAGRKTACMLQFKINPILLFEI